MKTKKRWCTLDGHFIEGYNGWELRLGIVKPPKKARCPDCNKQFRVQTRSDFYGEYIRYYIPPHKKKVK